MTPTFAFLELAARAMFIPPEPPAPEQVFLDTFTDANGVWLEDHTPDIPISMWTVPTAHQWYILDNSCHCDVNVTSPATVDVGIADYDLLATVVGTSTMSVVIRYSDNNNYWVARVTSLNFLEIVKKEAGITTTEQSAGPFIRTDPVEFHVNCDGTTILLEAMGWAINVTTATFNLTATKCGFRAATVAFDVFSVTNLV